jgi:hypothetical protein
VKSITVNKTCTVSSVTLQLDSDEAQAVMRAFGLAFKYKAKDGLNEKEKGIIDALYSGMELEGVGEN